MSPLKRRLHLVDDAGNWFFFTHHGHGQWYGRAASLLPATWIDGWLIVGKPEKDGIGTMVWNPERPVMKNPEPQTETARGFLPDDLGTLPRRQDGSVHVQRWR